MGLYQSTGFLKYFDNPPKAIVEVDQDIAKYYCSLIPKCIRFNTPMHKAHISVVRNETPPHMDSWKKYENLLVKFEYENFQRWDEKYIWLNVYCETLCVIRQELGLTRSRALDPNSNKFHITIGNFK